MNALLLFKIGFLVLLPLVALGVNGLHILFSNPEVRHPFLFPPVTTFGAYLKTHWLLCLGLACLVASWMWRPLEVPFHFLIASWFVYVNVCAIVRRQRKARKPTRQMEDIVA